MPFREAALKFDDGSRIRLSFINPELLTEAPPIQGTKGRRVRNNQPRLKLTYSTATTIEEWVPPVVNLNRVSPVVIRRAMSELGIKSRDGDGYLKMMSGRWSADELHEGDASAIRRHLARALSDESEEEGQSYPEWADRLFDSTNATLIETQRLVNYGKPSEDSSSPRNMAIDEVSRSVQLLMDQALAANSRISQQLDRTFPERVLSTTSESSFSETEIRQRHTEQLAIRQRLAEYHLASDDDSRVELPNRDLMKWEESFLGLYLDDSDEKLESFRELLRRLDLFVETLNKRFHRKRVFFKEDRSLAIESSSGRMLGVADLSSGEQHELILIKYLLFDAEPSALVLIDEPEISLHVAWQKAFLDDLQNISAVSNVRFIIATHSPQIINNSWHLTQSLGHAE